MRIIFSIAIVLLFFNSFSQSKYWIELDERKCGECVDQFSDWLQKDGLEVDTKSNWLKAVSIVLDDSQLTAIKNHQWVLSSQLVRKYSVAHSTNQSSDKELVDVLQQINATAFLKSNLNGKGVKIGVIDAGFVNVDSNELFEHLWETHQIKAVKDFVDSNREDFYTKQTAGCNHGREVLKRITGVDTEKQIVYGVATGADFYLARTENGDKEERIEEDNWVAAIEWMHENGVRLVNTSLGYGNDFDNPKDNYITHQMDGNTAMITKAAQIAVRDKGMIIVVSAGNNGRKEWQIVTAPGDCKEVITVGSTNKTSFSKVGYSSIGADFVNYIKPDVSCYSPNGTSYSAPIITGLVACMLQKDSTLTSEQVKDYLGKASNLYPYPNNYLGYGVPNAQKVVDLLSNKSLAENYQKISSNGATVVTIPIPKDVESVVLFHKSDEWKVLKQEIEKVELSKHNRNNTDKQPFHKKEGVIYFEINQLPDYKFTTVQVGNQIIEIEW